MLNPAQFTLTQWLNVLAFALTSLAVGAWWQDALSPHHATEIAGGLAWTGSLLNFLVTGTKA